MKDRVKARNIERVFHCTVIENLPGILNNDILSVRSLRDSSMSFESLDQNRYDNRLDYISCSIERPNTFYLSTKDISINDRLVEIVIDSKILHEKACLFFYYNAASHAFRHEDNQQFTGLRAFEKMFADVLPDPRRDHVGSFKRSDGYPLI